jgi:diketogulonate reductase-like aldo/keto reductase
VNQIELHPTFQQAALSAGCRAHGIAVEAYSPLGRGADLNVAAVTALATKHALTPAQIVLAWHLGVGNIVIPKTMRLQRMHENLAAAEITISRDEMDAITALDSSARIGPDPATAAFTQM